MSQAAAQKVKKLGIKKERGYLYYLDNNGDVCRVKMSEAGDRSKAEVIAPAGVNKVEGYLYFVDTEGDVSRAKISF